MTWLLQMDQSKQFLELLQTKKSMYLISTIAIFQNDNSKTLKITTFSKICYEFCVNTRFALKRNVYTLYKQSIAVSEVKANNRRTHIYKHLFPCKRKET